MTLRSLLLLVVLAFSPSCAWVPSSLRFGGSPLNVVEKKEDKRDTAKEALLKEAQRASHQTTDALKEPSGERRDAVAKDFAEETKAALDQALGAPLVGETDKWKGLVQRLVSENEQIRKGAELERAKDRAEIAKIAERLADRERELAAAEAKAREYAKETERIADMLRKVVWVAGSLAGLWALGQLLALIARFNPAVAGVSAVVNGLAAPAVQLAASRAEAGLKGVGTFLRKVEDESPELLARVEGLLRQATDADHQAAIIAARNKTYT